MNNFLLGYANIVDSSTLTASNSWQSTLPLSNIKTRELSRKARSVNDDAFTLTFDFSSSGDVPIGCVALAEHNFSRDCVIAIKGYKSGDLVYASNETYAWPYLDPTDGFFDTYDYAAAIISNYQITKERKNFIFIFDENKRIDKIEIEITDTSNVDGFIDIGRAFIGSLYQPTRNVNFGDISIGINDNTEIQYSRTKSKFFNELAKQRTASIVWGNLFKEEGLQLLKIQRIHGVSGELLFANGYPTVVEISGKDAFSSVWTATSFLSTASELTPLAFPNLHLYSGGFKLEEVL